MTDDRTRTADPRPETPSADATASDGRTPIPDSTRPSSRPHGDAPAGVVSIPGYEVRGELARGGMGRVLEAYDLTFGREVAIKVVLPGPDAAATAGRFVRESRITGRLTHPGIPPAYQLGELPDGSPFLAMKLVRGRTLAQLLAERPDVSHDLPRFVAIFEQVCQAVGYAHSRGIIHRDLKPANVMVGAFGEVQVMDWGLARDTRAGVPDPDGPPVRSWDATGSTIGDDRTQAGAVMGTPAYMAPEQARGEDVDARADVFALGGLLTMILVGRAPFQSTNADSALALAVVGDTSEVLVALGESGADSNLLSVARCCLIAERDDRPTDGREVASVVATHRQEVEERLRAAERDRAAAEATEVELRKRRRVQLWLAAAAVLLVAGAGCVAVWRVHEEGNKRAAAAQLDGDERARKARSAGAMDDLLDRTKAALEAGDAARAATLLDQAGRRAKDDDLVDHSDRLTGYRRDLTMLRAMDKVNDFQWAVVDSKSYPPPNRVSDRWAAEFAAYGIVLGNTPPADAAERINSSPIRATLVAGLDAWLALSESSAIRDILAVADPDSFRDEVRWQLVAGDAVMLAGLARRAEWAAQPSGLVQSYVSSRAMPAVPARELLLRLSVVRRTDFALLMLLGATYPVDSVDESGEEVRWYQAAATLRPENVAVLTNLGNALIDRNDLDGAEAAYRDAIRLDPMFAPPYNGLGNVLHDRKDFVGAKAAYSEFIRIEPTSFRGYSNLGNTLIELNELDGAAVNYYKSISLDSNFATPHNGIGNVLRVKGDKAGAEAAYRQAIRLDPTYDHPYDGLGRLQYANKDFVSAENSFRAAIKINPKSANAFSGLGNVLVAKGERTSAIDAYREAIRLKPKSALLYRSLGRVLEDRDPDEAAAAYREAARLAPEDASTYHRLGVLLHSRKDLAGAADAFREAVRIKPMDADLHNALGVVLRAKNDLAGAEAAWREAIRINPAIAIPYNNLGHVLRDKGALDEAKTAYLSAIRIDNKMVRSHNGLGLIYEARLEFKQAEAAYRDAIRYDPRFSDAHANLGESLRKQGRHADAIGAYQAALALSPNLEWARERLGYCERVLRGEVPTAPPPRAVMR